MKRVNELYGCPVELALERIGGKWKTVILARIKEGPVRYGDLRRSIPQLSDKVLTQRLHELVEAGLVAHDVADGRRSCYTLTERGRALRPALAALYDWGAAEAAAGTIRFR